MQLVVSKGPVGDIEERQKEILADGEHRIASFAAEGKTPERGCYVTGGRILMFRQGWAKSGFHGNLAHYFTRFEAGLIQSKCSAVVAGAGLVFAQGTFKRCRNCERHMRRRSGSGFIYPA